MQARGRDSWKTREKTNPPIVSCKCRGFKANCAPWQRGVGGRKGGWFTRHLLSVGERKHSIALWWNAFGSGLGWSRGTHTQSLGLAVQKCRMIRHLLSPEVGTLPRACVKSKIHLCDITLHLAGRGEQGCSSPALPCEPQREWGLSTATWALPLAVGTQGWCSRSLTQLQGSRRSPPCWGWQSVCALSHSWGCPLPLACTENFPIAGTSCLLLLGVTQASPRVSWGNTCNLNSPPTQYIPSCQVGVGGRHWLARRSLENTKWTDKSCCCIFFALRILSYNNLTRLDEGSLADLGGLHVLRLSHNSINHIAEGAFRGLKNLRVL